MAYVAITDRLVDDVKSKINTMEGSELNTLPNSSQLQAELLKDPAVLARIMGKFWEPVADIRERLEQYNKPATVQIRAYHTTVGEGGKVEKLRLLAGDFGKRDVPCTVDTGEGYYKYAALEVDETFDPRLMEILTIEQQHKEVRDRWEAVTNQVINFLRSCKSLNEAVKLWPEVTRYLPKEAVDRLNQNAPKQQKEASKALEALKAMDFDTINASTVLARMAGARV